MSLNPLSPTMAAFAAMVSLIGLHTPDGAEIFINPAEIVSMRTPQVHGHFAPGVKCLLLMSHGNLLSVVETCEQVRSEIQ